MELKLEKCNQLKIDSSNISILKDFKKCDKIWKGID